MAKEIVTVVYFELQGKKMYCQEMSVRPDNKILPIWTGKVEEAHQFEDESHAQKKISKFINHHDRVFKTESVEVDKVRRSAQFGSRFQEELK